MVGTRRPLLWLATSAGLCAVGCTEKDRAPTRVVLEVKLDPGESDDTVPPFLELAWLDGEKALLVPDKRVPEEGDLVRGRVPLAKVLIELPDPGEQTRRRAVLFGTLIPDERFLVGWREFDVVAGNAQSFEVLLRRYDQAEWRRRDPDEDGIPAELDRCPTGDDRVLPCPPGQDAAVTPDAAVKPDAAIPPADAAVTDAARD